MGRTIDVAFRYQDAELEHLGAVAVIDTLRATTTMTHILSQGALAIRPVKQLEEAYALKEKNAQLLLGGERHSRPPEGFDGGNSPYDWPSRKVRGERVVFTTTNGTAAIDQVRAIPRLVLAALTNATAVSRYLWELERPVLVVAAGTRGRIALEDVLAAGAVVHDWPQSAMTDAARIADALFSENRDRLQEAIMQCEHGRSLAAMGLERDMEFAARYQSTDVIPVMCSDGWIRANT